MKEKLSLDKLRVESFITNGRVEGGVPYITYTCPNQSQYPNCTQQIQACPWYSELGTVCCPESDWQPCNSNPICA